MRRIRSLVEIQRYAEDEHDEDFSDIFGGEDRIVDRSGSDSNSDRNTLMLHSKLSNNSWVSDDGSLRAVCFIPISTLPPPPPPPNFEPPNAYIL